MLLPRENHLLLPEGGGLLLEEEEYHLLLEEGLLPGEPLLLPEGGVRRLEAGGQHVYSTATLCKQFRPQLEQYLIKL